MELSSRLTRKLYFTNSHISIYHSSESYTPTIMSPTPGRSQRNPSKMTCAKANPVKYNIQFPLTLTWKGVRQ